MGYGNWWGKPTLQSDDGFREVGGDGEFPFGGTFFEEGFYAFGCVRLFSGPGGEVVVHFFDGVEVVFGEEAVEHGFVHSIMQRNNSNDKDPENKLTNKAWDLSAYQNAPQPPEPENKFYQRERLERFANMLLTTG